MKQEAAHHILNAIFDERAIGRLQSVAHPTDQLKDRIETLTVSDIRAQESAHHVRKEAWAHYLGAASTCGMFSGDDGKELLGRLQGVDDKGFRSAIAECFACWFFSQKLKLPLSPRPHGRTGKNLDLLVQLPTGPACVEVKAPYRARPRTRVWSGDDADKLADCLDEANKQFAKDAKNILVIVPQLRTSVCGERYQLIRAFLGNIDITVPIDPSTGPVGPAEWRFFQEGKFLKLHRDQGDSHDLTPRFTRVSAAVCIEDPIILDEPPRVVHSAVVLINPFAERSVDRTVFSPYPHIPLEDNTLRWSDGCDPFK